MITRTSSLFLRTLREDPADAEVPSHRLLVRAGYVRRVAPGGYSWLPLGLRVLRRIEAVVRDEMNAIGAQEIQFPALLPKEPYEATGRWTEYGDSLFRLKDRKGADYLLGPTHEELFTLTVKGEFNSYRDYPVTLYQIQTKYRDEARPRAGILRGREFVMKDSYSFDLDDEGLERSYQAHRAAYTKLFDRLGLEYVVVKATSGAMGGSASEEFLAVAETGEDTYVRSTESGYAANVEAVVTPAPAAQPIEGRPEAQVHHTPNTPTIESLVNFLNAAGLGREFTAADTLKNVMLKARQPGAKEWELVCVALPGDREVDMKRLEASLEPAEVVLLDEADFAKNPFLVKGYIGPKALQDNGVRYLADPRIVPGTAWVTGADKVDHHVVDLLAGRDFTPDGTIEAAEVREGDASPDGHGTLVAARGIEIGHIFQLGRKYADASSSTRSAPTPSRSGSRWGPTASASRGWSASSPSRTTTTSASSGRARCRRSTCTSSSRARTTRCAPAPRRSPPSWTPPVSRSSSTTARRRPASSSPTPSWSACRPSWWSGAAWPTASSRSRTGGRASAKRSRSTPSSSTWSSSSGPDGPVLPALGRHDAGVRGQRGAPRVRRLRTRGRAAAVALTFARTAEGAAEADPPGAEAAEVAAGAVVGARAHRADRGRAERAGRGQDAPHVVDADVASAAGGDTGAADGRARGDERLAVGRGPGRLVRLRRPAGVEARARHACTAGRRPPPVPGIRLITSAFLGENFCEHADLGGAGVTTEPLADPDAAARKAVTDLGVSAFSPDNGPLAAVTADAGTDAQLTKADGSKAPARIVVAEVVPTDPDQCVAKHALVAAMGSGTARARRAWWWRTPMPTARGRRSGRTWWGS